jgi:hypothetical protein
MLHRSLRWLGLACVLAAAALVIVTPSGATGAAQAAGGAAGGMYNWYTLDAGQSVEWDFAYPGKSEPTLIAFGIDPANSIRINVYTDEQWRSLGAGVWPVEPVGRGTSGTLLGWPNNQDLIKSGDLFWEAMAWPAVLYHIQLSNSSQGPARYWIAQAGPGAGELAPYAPLAPANPAPQAAAAKPAPAVQAQAPTGTASTHNAPPPKTLPVSGGVAPILAPAVGPLLVGAGWLVRRCAGQGRAA